MNLDPHHSTPLCTWALSELPWWTLAEVWSPAGFITDTLHVPWTWLLHARIVGPRAQSSCDKREHTWSVHRDSHYIPGSAEKGQGLHSAGSELRGNEAIQRQEHLRGFSWCECLPLSKAHWQTEVGWLQRIHGAPPFRLQYAKVVIGPTLAEKRSHHMGSGRIDWSGSCTLVPTWMHHLSLDFSYALSLLWKT